MANSAHTTLFVAALRTYHLPMTRDFIHTPAARRIGMRGVWRFWLLTFIFGLGGPLPLFLGVRERVLARAGS